MIELAQVFWDIRTPIAPPLTPFLHTEEISRSFLYTPSRKTTFEKGREAIKQAILKYEPGFHPTEIWIDSDQSGKPFIRSPDLDLHLSISHTHGSALGLVSQDCSTIGVDIEPFQEKKGEIVWKRLTPSEQQLISTHFDSRAQFALALWVAKESAFKADNSGKLIFSPLYEVSQIKIKPRYIEVHFKGSPLVGWVKIDSKWIKGAVCSSNPF
jgi:phosphopantetheinyl transferase